MSKPQPLADAATPEERRERFAQPHPRVTQADLVAELTERFGAHPKDWAFQCPACALISTGQEFKDVLADKGIEGNASDFMGRYCLGRLLGSGESPVGRHDADYKAPSQGCNWVAWGLIGGPMKVVLPEGKELDSFLLAPAGSTA